MKNYTLEDLKITNHLINSLNYSGIYTIDELLESMSNNHIYRVHGLGKKKLGNIQKRLEDLGFEIPCKVKSKKVAQLIDEVGDIYDISSYTKNYLIYKYKLSNYDVTELEKIMQFYDVKYNIRDIIDEGLDKKISHILYNNNIFTVNQLYRMYNLRCLERIRGISVNGKRMREITDFLDSFINI